ncbi:MAG: DUF885 domain-containing protein [Proteobacteria bacterium]|nr:DUF885 domain-containing protein [Pseudomonadota bacterium]
MSNYENVKVVVESSSSGISPVYHRRVALLPRDSPEIPMSKPSRAYDDFIADFHAHMTRDPNECVQLGVARHLDELPDPSLQAQADEVAEARALVDRAGRLDRDGLDFDAVLDLDLAVLVLESRIHRATYTFNDRTMRQQMPTAGDDISRGIFTMFINDPRPDQERLADITARIEKVPQYLDALTGRLDTPVERWVTIDLDQIAGLPEFFATLQDWAERVEWPDVTRFDQARARANEALHHYAATLRAMETTEQIHAGDHIARRIVELAGIELSLEELHMTATEFLAETSETIENLRQRLCDKYNLDRDTSTDDVQRYLNKRYAVAPPGSDLNMIIDRYREEHEKIAAFLKERDLFPIPDNQDIKIMRTPAFMAPSIPAGAMEPPAAFREGVRTSLVYLTLSEKLRDEHTELSIPNMMIHEGTPGHHLQLATASMHSSVVRRHVNANEHAEGWTTMLEDYMLDLGYMGDLTDEARFAAKREISRIGARVAIDLYFMTGDPNYLDVGVGCDRRSDNPFEVAGNLLAAVTGFVPERVQSELNWYSQERGYPLSYLTGNRLVWQLKRDIAQARQGQLQGSQLDRAFHTIYLQSGNMPIRFLRRVFEREKMIATPS